MEAQAIKDTRIVRKGQCKLILMIGFMMLNHSVFAQQRPSMPPLSLQDIRGQINQIESVDEKLRQYVEMSNRYLRNSPDSMLIVAEEIKKMEGLDQQKKEAFSLFITANAWRLLDSDSAIYYGNQASDILREIGEHDSYLMVENLRATQYLRQNEYVQAESLFLSAIDYQQNLNKESDYPIQYFYGNLGNLYASIGAHDLAITMFERFLNITDNPSDRCNILSKLSSSFAELGEVEKSVELLSPCLEYQNLSPPIMAIIRSNLSRYYEKAGESVQSLAFLEEAASITTRYRIPTIGNSNLSRLGEKYLELNRLSQADSVANLLKNSVLPFIRPQEKIVKYRFFAELEFTKDNHRLSIAYADSAIDIANRHDLPNLLQRVYARKADAFEQLGQINEALENQRHQSQLEQLQNKRSDKRNLEMMTVRYQLQNKEAQLLEISTKLTDTRVRNAVIITLLLLVGAFLFYRYRVFYLLKEEKIRNRIARDLHDDLSGTLSSISFFSEAAQRTQTNASESKRFLGMIDKSATEAKEKINDIIWAIDPLKDDWPVFLKKCKRFAADTLDSQGIDYEINIADNFDNAKMELEVRQNLWLIFKEMINNLVEHAEASKAWITFVEKEKVIYLEVRDNGMGFDSNIENEGHGIKNIHQRAGLINGESKMETKPREGTVWRLTIKG